MTNPSTEVLLDAGITLWYERVVAVEQTAQRGTAILEDADVSTQISCDSSHETRAKPFDGDLASLVLESCNVDLRQVRTRGL